MSDLLDYINTDVEDKGKESSEGKKKKGRTKVHFTIFLLCNGVGFNFQICAVLSVC